MPEQQSAHPLVMRTAGARGAAFAVWVSDVIALVAVIGIDRGWSLILGLSTCAAIALAIWIGAWRPSVTVDDDAVTLQNLVHDVRIPWAQVTAVSAGWSLVVETQEGSHSSWAVTGQAPRNQLLRRREGFLFGGAGRMGGVGGFDIDAHPVPESWRKRGESATRAAAAHIHGRWQARREAGGTGAVTITARWRPVYVLLGLVAVTVVSAILL